MWQRLSERARKVVFYAQEEAQKLRHEFVSTEHILLGLVRESDSCAARALEVCGVSRQTIITAVENAISPGASRPTHEMTLTPRAKRVIDLAYDEARNLNNNYIGTEHLLLGLIREADGIAGSILIQHELDLKKMQNIVRELQRSELEGAHEETTDQENTSASVFIKRSRVVHDALSRARSFVRYYEAKDEYVKPIHLLVALLTDPSEGIEWLLKITGADEEVVLERLGRNLNYAEALTDKVVQESKELDAIMRQGVNEPIIDSLWLLNQIWISDRQLDTILTETLGFERTDLESHIEEFREQNPYTP